MLNITKQLLLLGVLLSGIFTGCTTSSSDNEQSSSSSYESSVDGTQSSSSLPVQSSSSLSTGSVASSLDNASSSTLSQSSSSAVQSVSSSSHTFSSVAPVITSSSSSSQSPVIRSTPDNPFAANYAAAIPADATKVDYDERRFGVITGLIYSADETTPLEGVSVTIKDHSEYGSVLSDTEGRYQIATEASGIQILDFDKNGYTPIQRRVTTRWNQIATAPKITMLQVDAKSTTITLNSSAVQTHTASTIDDERGERAVTIVFDNVHKATVINKDGSSYTLETMNVRATEFTTPQSMPATLPPTSAFTYCIDVTVDGVDKDAMVHFDTNVSFFVDNFLGAPVGTVVPVGYYDRSQSLWIAMPNGIVVTLLDGNGDGTIDGVDADGDGVADDINGNDSTYDEAAGLGDKTRFIAGESFTMFYSDHFTSIDSNYGPGGDTTTPPPPDDDDDCNTPVKLNSYINPGDQSFHEDVSIPGTPYTLWYNSKNTKGYHSQKIQSLTNWIGSLGTLVEFDVAGVQQARIFQNANAVDETTFYWDRKDYLGNVAATPQNADIIVEKKDIRYVSYYCSWWRPCSIAYFGTYGLDLFGRDMQSIENASVFTPQANMSNNYITSNAYTRSDTLAGVDQNNIANGWDFTGIHDTVNSLLFSQRDTYEVVFRGTGGMPDFIDKAGKKYEHYYRIVVDDFGTIYKKQQFGSYSSPQYLITQQKAGQSQTTYLGGGTQSYSEGNTTFTDFKLGNNFDFTLDNYGNLIITDDNKVYKAYHDGRLVLFSGDAAGDAEGSYSEARFNNPRVPVVDKQGNIYVIDSGNHKIKKLDITGTVTTLIGQDGNNTHSGDYDLAAEATMEDPTHLAIDSQNNLYIGFGNSSLYNSGSKQERIRMITPQGIIKPVAGEIGGIAPWFYQPPVSAPYATMNYLQTSFPLLVGPNDELYVGPYMIRKVSFGLPPFDEATQTYHLQQGNQLKIFDTAFKHLQTLDTDTNTTIYTFSYNDANQLTAITDRYGMSTQIRYTNSIASSIIAPNGDETTLYVDANRNLSGVTFPDGTTQSFEYNANDLMTAMIEPKGNRFEHEYDEHGRLITFKDENGGEWAYENIRNATDRSRTLRQTMAEGSIRIQQFKHNTNNTTSINELSAEGDEHNITRNATGSTATFCNMQSTTEPYGQEGISSTLSYLESPTWYGYSSGTYGYHHVNDRIMQDIQKYYADENASEPQSVTYTTTTQAQPYSSYYSYYYYATPVVSRATTQTLDYTTNTLTQKSPAGREQRLTFNPLDMQPTKIEAEGIYPITLRYDSEGRLLSTKQESRETLYSYNAKGDLETAINARGVPTYYTYDAMHRMIAMQSEGIETTFTYDDNGNLISLTTPNTAMFQTTHDAINYPDTQISPLGHTTTYGYDKERRLTKITKPSNKSIEYTYKGKRVESISGDGHITAFSYGCGSRLESMSRDDGESMSYAYEPVYNRMTSQSYNGILDTNISFAYAPYQTSSYYYDATLANALIYHLPTSITYAGGTQSFTYDMDGLLSTVGTTTLTRDTQGRITKQSDTKGFSTTYTYNGYGEADDTITTHNNTTLFTQKILKRDEGGRILSKLEHLKDQEPVVTSYVYDRAGRLTQVQKDATITERYTYDNNGNRLSEEINTTIGTYNQEDQLKTYGTTEYEYDEDGYLHVKKTQTGTTTYEYGIFGELKSVTLEDGTLIEYQHNVNHQRVAKLINGEITQKYLWLNLTTLLATYDKDDKLITRYSYTSDRVPETMTQNGESYHLRYNHQGSLRAVVDANGSVVKEVTYNAFGTITNDTNPALHVDFGFAGGLYDPDSKLTRFGYRDYDAKTGKWTAKDPIGFDGGDTNLYGYVLGDPVNLVDPEGLNPLKTPYYVYKIIQNGRVIYVGITKNWAQRAAAHRARFNLEMEEVKMCLTKNEARMYEQGGIEHFGLPNLKNIINSIGKNNPKYNTFKTNENMYQSPWKGLK